MKVVLPLLVFLIVAWGNEEVSKVKSQSTNSLAQNTGILSILHPNIVGGGTQYDIALRDGNIFVPPLYRDQGETGYRIHFLGSLPKASAHLTEKRSVQS